MKSPTITFRLTQYQLACGLLELRRYNPTYIPKSINMLVKDIYFHAIQNISLLSDKENISLLMDEILLLKSKNQKTENLTLDKFLKKNKKTTKVKTTQIDKLKEQEQPKEEVKKSESVINTITDFSPPSDWNIK